MAEGFKAFAAATVLDAADLTDFCSSQAVMRFANAAGRDASLTVSIVKEGMLAFLKDTDVLQVNVNSTTTGWRQIFPVITAGITDAQITNAKMAADSVSSANIINATIVSGDIAAGTITGSNIASGTIAGSNIIDGTITGADIAAATISGSNIGSKTITGANITNGTVGGDEIANGSITSAKIVDGTIVGADIAAKTITGANILNGTIGTDEIAAGATYSINISGNAGSASDAALLDGFNSDTNASFNTIPVRNAQGGVLFTEVVVVNPFLGFNFYTNGTHTGLGANCARVTNATEVYSQAVTSARTVLINSAGTLGTSVSSRRYKTNIEPLATDTNKILQLDPVTFYYLPEMYEPDQDKRLEVGLIAEQAADLGLDQLVHLNADGLPEAIDYEKLAVYLLKVCKTQQTQIDALAERLNALEN